MVVTQPLSLALSVSRAGARMVTMPARGARAIIGGGLAIERRTRAAVTSAARDLALEAIDALLARLLSDDAVDHVMSHVEAAGVAQRVVDRMLDDGIVEQIAMRVVDGPELERVLTAAIESDRTQEALVAALGSEAVESLLSRLVASPGSERLVALVIDSPLLTDAITGLLESEELWILVDEIARSPSVTEAITHQGTGFVDQVADEVRDRSRGADAWLERTARRIGRRRKGGAPSDGVSGNGSGPESLRTSATDARAAGEAAPTLVPRPDAP